MTRAGVYGGLPGQYIQVMLDCPPGLAGNDCHRLSDPGLRGSDNAALETAARHWLNGITAVPSPDTLSLTLAPLMLLAQGAGGTGRARDSGFRAAGSDCRAQ